VHTLHLGPPGHCHCPARAGRSRLHWHGRGPAPKVWGLLYATILGALVAPLPEEFW